MNLLRFKHGNDDLVIDKDQIVCIGRADRKDGGSVVLHLTDRTRVVLDKKVGLVEALRTLTSTRLGSELGVRWEDWDMVATRIDGSGT